jgi:hypothetical protein
MDRIDLLRDDGLQNLELSFVGILNRKTLKPKEFMGRLRLLGNPMNHPFIPCSSVNGRLISSFLLW